MVAITGCKPYETRKSQNKMTKAMAVPDKFTEVEASNLTAIPLIII